MRHLITGLVAAVAVVAASAVPAMACGGGLFQSSCSPCGYVDPCSGGYAQTYAAPVYTAPAYSYSYASSYSGCGGCGGGYARQTLAAPVQQYYYANQGPTYTGPDSYAPAPSYNEGYYTRSSYYDGGYSSYRPHRYYRPYRPYGGYYHAPRSYRYGYAPRSYAPRVVYAPRHYGYSSYGVPHYGYRHERVLRRYY